MRKASTWLIAAVVVAGCASVVIDGRNIDGEAWRAVSVDGQLPIPGSESTLRFENGAPRGSGRCNGYASDKPAKVSFEMPEMPEMLMTLGACVGPNGDDLPVMAVENAFRTSLNAADRIGFRGDRLVISGTPGEIVFNPRPG